VFHGIYRPGVLSGVLPVNQTRMPSRHLEKRKTLKSIVKEEFVTLCQRGNFFKKIAKIF